MHRFSQPSSKAYLFSKKSVFLCFLLIGLISTQWIGLWHSVSHSNAQLQKAAIILNISQDDGNGMGHNGTTCQLLDNLALGSLIHSASDLFNFATPAKHVLNSLQPKGLVKLTQISYRSRAPPAFFL